MFFTYVSFWPHLNTQLSKMKTWFIFLSGRNYSAASFPFCSFDLFKLPFKNYKVSGHIASSVYAVQKAALPLFHKFSHMLVLSPPGNRHLDDPRRSNQENPQRRVSVLPLQPCTIVKKAERGWLSIPPPSLSGPSVASFGHTSTSRKAEKDRMVFWPEHVTF